MIFDAKPDCRSILPDQIHLQSDILLRAEEVKLQLNEYSLNRVDTGHFSWVISQ